MKTLLRHTRTGLYLKGPDQWTSDPDKAFDFHFIERALQYISVWDLKEVELAFAFESAESVAFAPLNRAATEFAAA